MNIKYLRNLEGPGISIINGDTASVSDEKGKRLIGLGYAEEVKSPRKNPEVVKVVISKSSTKSRKKK